MAVNWNLAGPGFDALQALQVYGAAQQKAVADRKTAAMDQARATAQVKAAAGDIAGAASDLIAAGDAQGATAYASLGKLQQDQKGRAAFSSYVRGQGGAAAAPAPTAAPQTAPASMLAPPIASPGAPQSILPQGAPEVPPEGDIVVTAPRKVPTRNERLAELADAGGADLVKDALEFETKLQGLDKGQREQLDAETEIVASMVPELLAAPPQQRAAILEVRRDFLNQRGIDDNEIAALDLSDGGLNTLQRQAQGVKAALALDETKRSNAASEEDRDAARALTARGQDITLRGQNMTDARVREGNAINAAGIGKQQRKTETDLRKEFDSQPIVKGFKDLRPAFQTIRNIAMKKRPNPQDDTALTYNVMKMFAADGSAVREGEYALVARGAGLGERVVRAAQAADTGQSLTPAMRRDLLNAAKTIYTTRRQAYNEAVDQYQGYAKDYGVNPGRIGRKYLSPADRKAPTGSMPIPGYPGFTIRRGK